MAPKRQLTPPNTQPSSNIWLSKKTHFSDSSFIAAFSSVLTYDELKKLPEFDRASHKIGAWRTPSKQRTLTASTTYVMRHEDDGERNGGQLLLNLLVKLNVEGCIVVARWFGGTMIGQKRWTMISDAATEAIQKWSRFYNVPVTPDPKRLRFGDTDTSTSPATQKSSTMSQTSPTTASLVSKPQDPVAEHRELVSSLKQRDENIPILRKLLADMRSESQGTETTPARVSSVSSPARIFDYPAMPLAQLQRLLAARDATINLLLKQMEDIEKKQKADEDELNEALVEAADKLEKEEASAPAPEVNGTAARSFG